MHLAALFQVRATPGHHWIFLETIFPKLLEVWQVTIRSAWLENVHFVQVCRPSALVLHHMK